jgi:hypothetical protein
MLRAAGAGRSDEEIARTVVGDSTIPAEGGFTRQPDGSSFQSTLSSVLWQSIVVGRPSARGNL